MKVLLVYPEFPDTFWSFKHALPFPGKRSAYPPLGLLTVSALRQAGLNLIGVVMVGEENAENRRAIERYGNIPVIGMIPLLDTIDRTALRAVFDRYFDKAALQ